LDLQAIRDYVRGHMDLDIEDLPDVVLDVFIREGSKRIERAEARWPFYEETFTLTTTVGTSDYDFSTIASNVDEIASIVGPRWTLRQLGRDEGDSDYPLNITSSGEPAYFSVWGSTLRLYPVPDTSYNLVIRGYRTANDWVADGSGAEPDLPSDLHNTVAQWALARAYAQQDDPEMAALFERQFADEIALFRRRFNDAPRMQPIVLNGHTTSPQPWRPRYDWM
jgi:hypothetical protein